MNRLLILALAPWISLQAQNTPALEFRDSSNGTQVGVGFVTGYQFTLKTPVQVTQLGAVLAGSSATPNFGALPASMPVGLWDSSRNLVASAVVSSANPRTGHFNFASVTPALLKTGEVYTVGGLIPAGQSVLSQVLGLTTAAEVSYVAPVSMISNSLAFPSGDVIKIPNGYLGPGFAFTTAGSGAGGGTLPYGVSVTPAAGSGAAGISQNLQFAWASPAGQLTIGSSAILIQDSASPAPSSGGTFANACYLLVSTTGATTLADDSGANFSNNSWVGYGYASSPSNSHCALNGPASSLVSVGNAGASEQVTLNLSFNPAWNGKTLSIWLQSLNANYKSGAWQQFGSFTVVDPAAPGFTLSAAAATVQAGASGASTVTVTPVNGFNSAVTLSASGWPPGITGTFGSGVTINVASGVAPGPYSLTVNGVSGGLSVSTTIALTVTPAGASGGVTLPYGVSVTPSVGSGAAGAAQNLQFAWASPAGQLGIGSSAILIQDSGALPPTSGGTFANACYLSVSTTGATNLADDTGLNFSGYSWVGYGYASSPSNSHCALNGPASSQVAVGTGGSTEQVTLNLTFNPAWNGKTLSIWLQSQNTNYKSGTWQPFGTFTVGSGAASPSFTLSATAATVQAGSSGSSTITVTPVNGFNSAVTLSGSGWPSGITGTFGSGVTINVAAGVAAGSYSLTVNGVSGALNASTTIPLTVTAAPASPSFTLSATAATVQAGSSGTSTITVTKLNGFNSAVTLSGSGWPSGITGTFGSGGVTINVAAGVASGFYSLSVNGVSGALNASTTIALTVTPAGLSGGGTLPYGVSVTPSAGSGASGVAQNLQFTWASPAGQPGIGSSSILIQDAASPAPSSGGAVASACYLLVSTTGATTLADDTGFNFSNNSWVGYGYASSPSNSHCALNGPASSQVTVGNGGSTEQVTLNLVFNPVWNGKTLSIWLQSQNTNYKSGTWQQFGTFSVGSGSGGGTLSATAATVPAGSSGSSTVSVTGFSSPVTLAASGWLPGITGTFAPNPASGSSIATINVASGVAPGPYSLTVNGVSGALNVSTTIGLTVTPAGVSGGITLPYGVSVTPSAGSGAAGVAQNLQFAWASPAGQPAIGSSAVLIQDSASPAPVSGGTFAGACYLIVSTTGAVVLVDDSGLGGSGNSWVGYGYGSSPSNSHCALSGPASSQVAVGSGGATEQVTLNLTFNPAWTGKTLSIWMQSQNSNYKSGPWQQFGTFTVH